MRFLLLLSAFAAMMPAQDQRILVVTASSGDYIFGAGGVLAQFIREGWRVDVVQMGNGDKDSLGLNPAQTRLANTDEGKAAAKLLGVRDFIMMDHKSGELGYTSSTEMRNQLFALIRGIKPKILFIPDPYVHYVEDQDLWWVGRVAEEAWGYSGGGTFGNELTRMGLPPYGAPEIFYYSPLRPYRQGEGGVERAGFVNRNIGDTLPIKLGALDLLHTRNRRWVAQRIGLKDDHTVTDFVRAFATEMAEAIGAKHGYRYGEEFNHVGPRR